MEGFSKNLKKVDKEINASVSSLSIFFYGSPKQLLKIVKDEDLCR